MKKIIAIMLAMASTAAFSANITPGTAIPTADCTYLKEPITPRLSTDVKGAFACSASKVGIGTAAVKGKGRSYGLNSDGGAITETAEAAPFADATTAQSAAGTAATTQLSGSSGS